MQETPKETKGTTPVRRREGPSEDERTQLLDQKAKEFENNLKTLLQMMLEVATKHFNEYRKEHPFTQEDLDKRMVGYQENLLPLMVEEQSYKDAEDLLKQVSDEVLDDFYHQHDIFPIPKGGLKDYLIDIALLKVAGEGESFDKFMN